MPGFNALRILRTAMASLILPAVIVGCGSDDQANAPAIIDNTADVIAYYEGKPDFFQFKTPADIPEDLTWEDGSEQPELGSSEAKKGGTQQLSIPDFPRTLRTLGPDANGSFRTFLLDDMMVALGPVHPETLDYYAGVAESWAVDYENQTVYVRLDPNARWTDGMPVTVDDMFFMFYMYQSPHVLAPWYNNWYSTQYTNITRYDDLTFSITVPDRKPDMAGRVLGLSPLPRHFFREFGEDYVDRYQWRFMPTTGAYTLRDEDIRKGRSIALTRVDRWWGDQKKNLRYRFNPARLQFSVIRDAAKTFEAFKRGDIDNFALNLAEYWYDKLPDSDPDVTAGYIHKTTFYNQFPRPPFGLWINTARPLLNDRDIRVGINYASNWQLVIDKFFRGDATRKRTASDGFGEFTNPDVEPRPFDVTLAREAFARAGFDSRGPDGVLRNAAGERLSFGVTTGYEALKDILTILKEEAIKAGLELRIEVLDSTAGWKKMQEKKHDIAFVAFGGFLEMYPRYWEHYHSANAYDTPFLPDGSVNPERSLKVQTNNLESLASREMDELIERYDASDDREEMIVLAHQLDALHAEYASFVPGYNQGFYRVGHWRWLRYPEGFNAKHSASAGEYFLHWIDEELKAETLQARRDGRRLDPEIRVYDQHREE